MCVSGAAADEASLYYDARSIGAVRHISFALFMYSFGETPRAEVMGFKTMGLHNVGGNIWVFCCCYC